MLQHLKGYQKSITLMQTGRLNKTGTGNSLNVKRVRNIMAEVCAYLCHVSRHDDIDTFVNSVNSCMFCVNIWRPLFVSFLSRRM